MRDREATDEELRAAVDAVVDAMLLALYRGTQYALILLPNEASPFMAVNQGEARVH